MLQLLILLLTIVTSFGTACPTMCVCKHFPREAIPKNYLYYTAVKCRGFNSSITLDNSTRILEVSDLNVDSFNDLVLSLTESDLPDLNTLIFRKSVVYNISDCLDVLSVQIRYLSLSHNNLTFLPELPENSSNLISLDLSNNNIEIFPSSNSLRTLRTLEILNLSANSLNKINPASFQNLTNLKCLDLSKNNLTHLENEVLTPLKSLQYLNLSHNHIEVLSEQCFSSLIMLQQLDVSWNSLARVAPGSLQLPSLARLLLAGNPRLGGSREVLVGVGRRLQSVDASQTGLKQVPAALTHSIRTLRLAGNSIKTVNCGELDSYPLLQLLDFSSNDLVSIEEDALGRLESLFILYLTDNKIRNIPKSLPEALTVLHLEFNEIEKVSRDDLEGLPRLEVLLLNDNKIRIIEEGAFRHLLSLITLDLSRNLVSVLHPGSLSGPSALQVLRLSGIEAVSPAADVSFPLSTPDHLITLDLSGSPGLARQFLADTAALAASRELQELDISGADLEFIRSDLLHFLSQLRIMHIKDNRLNCSNLQWLAVWMRRQDQAEYRDVVCASPSDLWGTPLLDLQYVEISPIKHINHERVWDSGSTINLERKATATESSSLLGKYTIQGILHTSAPITNDFINSSVNTTTEKSLQKTITPTTSPATEVIYLESIKENESIDKNNSRDTSLISTERREIGNKDTQKSKFNKGKKQIATKKKAIIKSVDKTLLSSAALGRSSLIPVTNGSREEYSATKTEQTTLLSRIAPAENAVNQAELGSTEKPANDQNYPENLPTTNSNKTAGALNKAPAQLNLVLDERILNSTPSLTKKEQDEKLNTLLNVNITETTSQWNGSTVEMSMYTNNERQTRLLHPGMLILAAGILCGAATLAMLAARFNSRKKRLNRNMLQEDIEVASLSSVTELW